MDPAPCSYSFHAREQMGRRGVAEEAVEHVLDRYHTRIPAEPRVPARPAEIFIGTYDGRELKVYVEIGTKPPYVKTVAWVER